MSLIPDSVTRSDKTDNTQGSGDALDSSGGSSGTPGSSDALGGSNSTPCSGVEMDDCGDLRLVSSWQRIIYGHWVVGATVKNESQW